MTEEGSKYPFVSDQTHNCIKRTPCFLAKDVSSLYLYVLPKNKRDKNHVFLLSGVGCSILLQKHPIGCIAEFQSLANTRGITSYIWLVTEFTQRGFVVFTWYPTPLFQPRKGEEEGFDPMGFSLAIDIRWLREVDFDSDRFFGCFAGFLLNNKTWEKLGTYTCFEVHIFGLKKRNLLTKTYWKYMEITTVGGCWSFLFVWYHLLWTWSSFLWYSICDHLTLSW